MSMDTNASRVLFKSDVYRNVGRLKITSSPGSERVEISQCHRNGDEDDTTKMTFDDLNELRDFQYAISSIIEDCDDAFPGVAA